MPVKPDPLQNEMAYDPRHLVWGAPIIVAITSPLSELFSKRLMASTRLNMWVDTTVTKSPKEKSK